MISINKVGSPQRPGPFAAHNQAVDEFDLGAMRASAKVDKGTTLVR